MSHCFQSRSYPIQNFFAPGPAHDSNLLVAQPAAVEAIEPARPAKAEAPEPIPLDSNRFNPLEDSNEIVNIKPNADFLHGLK